MKLDGGVTPRPPWAGARAARIWPPLVPIAAIGAFTAAGLAARAGCGCQEHTEHASGAGAAAALAVHRFLEGSAVVLAGPAVAVALAVHAFAEGLATGALLALAAGILTQAARISLRAAFHGLRTSPLPLTHTAAVTTTAAIITVLAVHTAG